MLEYKQAVTLDNLVRTRIKSDAPYIKTYIKRAELKRITWK